MAADLPANTDAERLRRLIEVGRSMLTELRLETVLDRVLETARELTGARFAALGILDADKRELARFITKGVNEATHRAIGELPRGRGVLGALISHPEPLRLHDVSDDARSYGLPAGHPPMSTFLGVPILLRGEAWGNLYLTDKHDGKDFDEDDEASVVVLADWAAIAIENARLYEALDARRDELERAVRGFEATAAIAQAVGADTDLGRVLELVVKRGRALVNARSVLVLLIEGSELIVAAAAGQATSAGGRLSLGQSLAGDVVRSRHAVRVDDVDRERGLDGAPLGVPDASAALLVPLVYRGRALGVMCAFDRLDEEAVFDDDDEQLLRAFAASAATAVATAKSVEEGRLRTALEAAESERRRWARELHDETLQGLGALKMTLSAAARTDDSSRMRGAIDITVEALSREIDNLRAMITELRPASLDALGLVPALETLATRTESVHGLDVRAHFEIGRDGDGRLDPELETAVYRVAQEGLTNIAKHARAEHVDITLRREGDRLRLAIADDGVGFDPSEPSAGFGLVGMAERVALVGGTLDVDAGQGGGVRLEATFPIDQSPSSPRSSA